MHALAEDALDNDRDAEDVRPKALTSEQKVQQYTAKWKGVHHRIEKSLEEIKASLEGDAIDSLEVLEIEEHQLMQVRESLKESASLMNSIITEDPEQTDAMMDSEAAKSVQAVSKIRACEKRLAKFRATINASKTSSMGAAAPTIVEPSAAPSQDQHRQGLDSRGDLCPPSNRMS